MKGKFIILFIGILLISFVSAVWWNPFTWFSSSVSNEMVINQEQSNSQIGSLTLSTNARWTNTKCTEKECSDYELEIADQTKPSTIICLTSKDTSPKSQTMAVYDSKGLKITDIQKTTALSKDKYCYDTKNNKETYLAFEKTNIVEYKNQTTLNYDGASKINITLYKFNGKEYVNNAGEQFVNGNKFGSIDKDNLGIEQYKYELTGNNFIIKDKENKFYTIDRKLTWVGDQYEYVPTYTYYDFKDVCSKDKANCIFNLTEQRIEVYFNSERNIDPIITITATIVSGSSLLTNVRRDDNFTHLVINTSASPYNKLIAYIPFDRDDNITAFDFSNLDINGDYAGGTKTINGKYGLGTDLNGSSQINFPTQTIFDVSANVTISAWVKPDYARGIIFANRYRYNSNEYGYIFSLNNSGALIFATGNSGNNNADGQAISANATVANNTWTHIGVVRTGNKTEFYINGVLTDTKYTVLSTITYLGTITTRYISYCDDSYSGSSTYKFADTRYFDGIIDEFMVFNNSLTSTEMNAIYSNTSSRFLSSGNQTLPSQNITLGSNRINMSVNFENLLGSSVSGRVGYWQFANGYNETKFDTLANTIHWTADNTPNATNGLYNGTLMGGATYGSGVYNASFVFDGDGDYVNITQQEDILASNYTLSIWLKSSMFIGAGNYSPIYSSMQDVGGGTWLGNIVVFYDNSFGIFEYGAFNSVSPPSGVNISNGDWHNIIFTQSHQGLTNQVCLVDGVQSPSCNEVLGHTAVTPTSTMIGSIINKNPAICGGSECFKDFNGSIDDLILINRTLTSTEAQQLYISGLAKYNYTAYQTLTSGVNSTFNLTTTTLRVIPDLKLDAGTNQFYSPLVYGSVVLNDYNVSEAPPSDDTSFTVAIAEGYTEINFTVNKKTTDKINAVGQTSVVPIINITNTGNVGLDVYIQMNETESGFNLFSAITNDNSTANLINTTAYKIITNLGVSNSQGIWMWLNWTEKTPQTIVRELNTSVQKN